MCARLVVTAIYLAGISTALAADVFNIRPGKWEVTLAMDTGGQKMPPGMPFAEPMKEVACITQEDILQWKGPIPMPDEPGCNVVNYKATATELSYQLVCKDMSMDVKGTLQSPDAYTVISSSHGKNPSEKLIMRMKGKRIGPACTAAELAKERADREEE